MKLQAICAALVLAALLSNGCELGIDQATSGAPAQADATAAAPSERMRRGELQFVEGYEQGYAEAVRQGKPMLIFFTAEWCKFCHQMADEAFTHPQVVRLSEQFVCILVDADAEAEICRRFNVSGYPTIQFVSPRGTALDRIVGKQPGHQLMMAMQAALQNLARPLDSPSETFLR